jgi:hypothetical protein
MSMLHFLAAGLLAVSLASCAPRRPEPAPLPPTPPPAPPPPPQIIAPPPLAWQDAPLSPGDWTYREEGGRSSATYGSGGGTQFVLRCDANRSVTLARTGVPGMQASSIVVRTSFGERRLPATVAHLTDAVASLAGSDALLDEMAFSRGRFAVEVAGAPLLILPTWPEIARVAEDCRS